MKLEIEIKDKDSLIKIFKIISWIDDCRWNNKVNYNFIHFCRNENDFKNCEKILTHWICYITDRQMPFEDVWDRGGYVFSELVYDYSRSNTSPKEILDKYYKEKGYDNKKGKKRFEFKSIKDSQKTFASRYITDDYQNILQTLEVLSQEYGKDIIKFIIDIMKRFLDKKDLLIRMACGLHLLTYELDRCKKANSPKAIKILKDDKIFNKKLEIFKENSTKNKKRLWCCVRDYKKGLYYEIFNKGIRDVFEKDADEFIKIWVNLPKDQIELPGDIWNNSPFLKDNLFASVLNIKSIPIQLKMPEIIRELYNQLKEDKEVKGFYPEQLDITFDFVPRMCRKKLCNVCFFGKNGIKSICIPTQDKCCPVALISCGYYIECRDQNIDCLIKKDIGKGICKEIKN